MLSPAHARELQRALAAVETVAALRLEERQCAAVHGGDARAAVAALVARPLGLDGSEGLPALNTWDGDGPLARVVSGCALTSVEATAVTAAVAPAVDEKFAVMFGLLSDRPGVVGLTVEALRTLCARTFHGRLAAASLLASDGVLRTARLLRTQLQPGGNGAADGMTAEVAAEPALVNFVLGLPPQPPTVSGEFPGTVLHTVHSFDDLVVAPAVRTQLHGVLARIRHARQVLDTWGFGAHHDGVRGTLALFHGPPGSGKTMAAAVLAQTAGLPALRLDVAALVSKYVGETSRNLARVFDEAEARGWLLFFDEADALFGKRTEVSDAHDRYANQEISYLLQRIEEHRGMVILATNLKGNLDEAFQRRIDIEVEFPKPGERERRVLWQKVVPPTTPLGADVDLDALAERYPMTGAEIRDAVVEAAYQAADDGQVVTQELLVRGIRGQFTKHHRSIPPAP